MDDSEQNGGAFGMEVPEELTLIERVERFCASGSLVQRQVYVREIAACAEAVGVSVCLLGAPVGASRTKVFWLRPRRCRGAGSARYTCSCSLLCYVHLSSAGTGDRAQV